MFRTVLIANRGEIAVRVARTCRELGIRVVAVYSTADRDSAVVRLADAAVQIGPAPLRDSYLNIPAIIEAARQTGAEAIHPGYGFLSEDPVFAEVCHEEGLVFIGPPPGVIARLGEKSAARALMAEHGLPLLPGNIAPVSGLAEAAAAADRIGCPLIIKAVAGGGGRGMSVVRDASELGEKFETTRATARALFGDDRVYLERYLRHARHVEVQILADQHGNVVHLGERDCTVQRRHQKLVEESPAPELPRDVADRMGRAAVEGARRAGYVGAGTFEFVVDGTTGEFFFLEVNCRIQVEHPVTELRTGIDLVEQQLRVAAGEPLAFGQDGVTGRGVAIECRINAEEPAREFAPAPGVLDRFAPPDGPFVRVDSHAYPGYRIPSAYDSLLAKLIVWAPDRPRALDRLRRALDEFAIGGPGVSTTAEFLRYLTSREEFRDAVHTTAFADQAARHWAAATTRS
ncbi:acetyl-CoA carboxylase biotin carboxylase subunit [Amycolatopsis anabasis]|uniref:acetyl-CoA carboxylase biotin carboxylase subunit n=1 Tax=Amycolatopsis anabasis TaxID=1840409 RepID=UPI00131EAA79|nr:acetyl-CoA carboxylase biotin carboxylase subunit [Amycolatopsis anabasis]